LERLRDTCTQSITVAELEPLALGRDDDRALGRECSLLLRFRVNSAWLVLLGAAAGALPITRY
jgi:hypothetical protein